MYSVTVYIAAESAARASAILGALRAVEGVTVDDMSFWEGIMTDYALRQNDLITHEGNVKLAETKRAAALWYAWGQIDAGVGSDVLTLEDGERFARAYANQWVAYWVGAVGSIDRLIGSWRIYCAERGVYIS